MKARRGQAAVEGAGDNRLQHSPARAPSAKPTFTLKEIRAVIPKHCFERSALTSFCHLTTDVLLCGLMYYGSTWIDHPAVPRLLAWCLLWPAYWFIQGAFATGIWVMAHECGHGAFSDHGWLNDAVGLVFGPTYIILGFCCKTLKP